MLQQVLMWEIIRTSGILTMKQQRLLSITLNHSVQKWQRWHIELLKSSGLKRKIVQENAQVDNVQIFLNLNSHVFLVRLPAAQATCQHSHMNSDTHSIVMSCVIYHYSTNVTQ